MLYMIQFFNKDQKELINKYIEIFKTVTNKYYWIYDCLFIKIDDQNTLNNICNNLAKDKVIYIRTKIENNSGFYCSNLIKFVAGEIENSDSIPVTKQQENVRKVLKHLRLLG